MNGIDCATKLNSSLASSLKSSGVMTVGRYLGRTLWNGLTPDEVKAIHNAGLSLFLIWETNPTKASYFNYNKGVSDAQQAIAEAEYLGAPHGICIYFTVDYEAQPQDMGYISMYLNGVRDGLGGKYLVGIYGSYAVMKAVKADRYFQTYAWSYGNIYPNHIFQYKNNVNIAGVSADQDYVNENSGLWFKAQEEVNDVLDVAVLLFSKEDYWAGEDVAVRNGNCAIFVRPVSDRSVPKDAMSAKKLFVVGGPKTGHPNEVYLSGNDKYDTASAVKKYLG